MMIITDNEIEIVSECIEDQLKLLRSPARWSLVVHRCSRCLLIAADRPIKLPCDSCHVMVSTILDGVILGVFY